MGIPMHDMLFTYGTLQDPQLQKALLGKTHSGQKAWLNGWGLFMGEDGYLFVKPFPGGRVQGHILFLDTDDLRITDNWEDLAVYTRERCRVFISGSDCIDTWIYTRRHGTGVPYHGDLFHGRDQISVLTDIENTLKQDQNY
jgi:gamma-glutamylcyclotransferase (GGCT)/AIG2-like uncharacterized protein YtfP